MLNKKKSGSTHLKVNLLPKDPFYDTLLGKTTTWALSVGRYIVIFTEIVVILSFLSRFQLDRQLTDLNKEIVEKKAVIDSYGELEQNVRDIQKKIANYQQLKPQRSIKQVFDELSLVTPESIEYIDLNINSNSVEITGRTQSTQALRQFITNLQLTNYFSGVSVEHISNSDNNSPGFDFKINAGFRQNVAENTTVVQ